ncbi:PD-(D/E)XK nuclease family protein [Georgenia sp. 10Sc9-8]|uniref:DNA 3'-5' helicase n=1 Tax=Georgenia halotolerans TaxID=3028317 RepID=A0ABT5U2B6_9MICO|nr:PD-(D/E)XK nuclease family protein [Georgenia halotolerans]
MLTPAASRAGAGLRLRLPEPVPAPPALDPAQQTVVCWPPTAGHLLAVGAPGTGKTTTAIETFLARAAGSATGRDDGVLLLVPTRRGAARVRDVVAGRLGRTTDQVMVRTPASFAYSVLRMRATLLREPPPTLITGPEQDQVLAELLAGHRVGLGAPVGWPASVPEEAQALPAFRDELRDLFMRAAELGLGPAELAHQGRVHQRPEWGAAATLLQEYQQVTALGETTPDRGDRLDAARIIDEAVAALRAWTEEVPGHPRPRWGTVVVDDHQDSTRATARMLRVLAQDGAQLVLLGDPDVGVQGFRGGSPGLVGAATTGEELGGFGAAEVVLGTVHRGDERLRAVTGAVTEHIATAGVARHRRARAAAAHEPSAPSGLEVTVLGSGAQEAAYLARRLREEHLHHRTPWSQMAVIVRSAAQVTSLRRALQTWRVPAGGAAAPGVLRHAPAVRPLLVALAAVLAGRPSPEQATELLSSPVGGMDAVALRALRRTLRARERAEAGTRPVEELVAEVVTTPALAETLPAAVRLGAARVARVLRAGAEALAQPAATAETVLWALWHTTGLSRAWRDRALAGGPGSERADADLDAVMALFRAAEQFTDREHGAGPVRFLEHVLSQELPADTLAAQGVRAESVQVLTPAAAAGEEWQVVAVAGLQEDAWPDLRLRDSLLGAGALADVVAGRSSDGTRAWAPARREVLDDELRMLAVAVSRAGRRLLATAVLDEDQRPSVFAELLTGLVPGGDTENPVRTAPPALDLRGLVAELRAELDSPETGTPTERRRTAAALLARLAAEGVPGADPAAWSGLLPPSSHVPLRPPEDPVTVSPSAVERATTCPLRWALEQAGGHGEPSLDQSVGSLVHEIAADLPHGDATELHAALDARWSELGLGQGWVASRQRRLADQMIDRLAGYVAGVPGRVDVEREFRAEVGRAHLVGRMDRVEHTEDGAVRVVDLKTSASPVSKEDAVEHPQLGSYQLAVAAGAFGERRPEGARLVYLGTGSKAQLRTQPALADAEDPGWAAELVTDAAETMAGASFLARLNPQCTHCPVRTSCPLQTTGERVTR